MQQTKDPVPQHFSTARGRAIVFLASALVAVSTTVVPAQASSLLSPPLSAFLLQNSEADGSVNLLDNSSFVLTGGNTGSGLSGTTDFDTTAADSGTVTFNWSYSSLDTPGYDSAGFLVGSNRIALAETDGESGVWSFAVTTGDQYGWWVDTADNMGEPGIFTVTIQADAPEPGGLSLALLSVLMMAGILTVSSTGRRRTLRGFLSAGRTRMLSVWLVACASVFAQTQTHYAASSVTGQLTLARTTNPVQLQSFQRTFARANVSVQETPKLPFVFPHPALSRLSTFASSISPSAPSLTVIPSAPGLGFNGLTHYDQRLANSGNQFSVEPPNPSIAVANGMVLEGVNNAIQVYTQDGTQLLATLSSNQLFGVAPAIDRSTGVNGVYPTDMRVYFDQDIQRWFVLQRSQDNDASGAPLDESHIYLAVTQTSDPLGNWNVYVMNTSNPGNPGCPCVPDFPQIGSDRYGFYISANEYSTQNVSLVDSTILAISKSALGHSAIAPPAYRFTLPFSSGFEFSLQPATAPPGASNLVASGGVEFFISSQAAFASDSHLALWALSNSASLDSATTSLLLTQAIVPIITYFYPGVANQRPGPTPLGDSDGQPLAFIDGNPDSRVLSASYAGGRLFVTLPTQVIDSGGRSVVGGAYAVLSPTFRNSILAATVLKQGYLSVQNNHILRPGIAVNAQGRGAIAFTIAGPDYYPSAAFTALDTLTTPATAWIAAAGAFPEDGFTGYAPETAPVARWGDYSTAVASSDGSIWMVSEYIPNSPRTTLANWGTFISKFVP